MLVFPDIPSITFFERKIEPAASHIEPKRKAIPNVTVLAPTGVPHEFAESFAPTANDKMNPKTNAASIAYKPKSRIIILQYFIFILSNVTPKTPVPIFSYAIPSYFSNKIEYLFERYTSFGR